MRRRVVITGMGAVTPLGHDVKSTVEGQLAGKSGVGPIEQFDARTFPTTFAAEVKGFDLASHIPEKGPWDNAGANTRFAFVAAKQALAQAGLFDDGKTDRSRMGVYLGSGEGVQDFHAIMWALSRTYDPAKRDYDVPAFTRYAMQLFHPEREAEQELHTTAAHLARYFAFDGPNLSCLTACAASSQAIGEATELIRHGDADIMLAGGAHSMIHPFGVTGFNLLTALSQRNDAPSKASRPFDAHRDGFVLGEGAGMLILEELEHAKKRGAVILAELTGYGTTADAFRVTDSHEDGRGAIACISGAIQDSGLGPDQIDYINAHGTSTKVNDRAETLAAKAVFGERAYKLPMSSSKSMLGHLIAAGGAVELITCIESIHRGWIPPTINYETPDPECDLDYVPNQARQHRVRHALSNSFGFGGQNISLLVSKFES
jgi:3-oxoacyl-[acyl-carrier-protein] synthase II